ncbi:MAG: 50S ribosomal protein L21 [Phycisphaerae bacterium]
MYAIIEQGSKQYKVAQGDMINIELADVPDDAQTLEIDKVLFLADGKDIKLGSPYVDGAKVVVSFASTASDAVIKGPKLYPTYFRRRKASKNRIGHRQKYLQVRVDEIKA